MISRVRRDTLGDGRNAVRAGVADEMLERIGLRVLALRVLLAIPLDRLDHIDVVAIGQAVLLARPADLLERGGLGSRT